MSILSRFERSDQFDTDIAKHDKFACDAAFSSIHPSRNNKAQKPRILLLQGPVGPFAGELHFALKQDGYSVEHVAFNAADQFFSRKNVFLRFKGGKQAWERWLHTELKHNPPVAIILFGSNRPAHVTARRVARQLGVKVISLEEGYLRSGYITCEFDGNNQHSSLTSWRHDASIEAAKEEHPIQPVQIKSSFPVMSIWGIAYYIIRDALAKPNDAKFFHRKREPLRKMVPTWVAHMARRLSARLTERSLLRQLRQNPGYILVPFQVSSDSQLRSASRGWDTPALVEACLKSLVATNQDLKVVFKFHPLERDAPSLRKMIASRVEELGIAPDSVLALHNGKIGEMARDASGMIVINSTCAFSALHNDIPVLTLGDAVYRHDDVVTVGHTAADVKEFFKNREAKPRNSVRAFLTELRAKSLLAGDFYIARGRRVAISGILAKVAQLRSEQSARGEADQ